MIIPLRVAKAGYYGGDPGRVRDAPIGDVLTVMEYENFLNDYEITDYIINQKD